VVERRGPCPEKKFYNSKPTAVTARGFKKCQTLFFPANTIKKSQKNAKA